MFISSIGDTIFSDREKGIKILGVDKTVQNDSLGKIFGISADKRGNLCLAAWAFPYENMHGGLYCYNGKNFKDFKKEFGINDLEILYIRGIELFEY